MKRYFITGMLVLVPLGITFWVLRTLLSIMDESLLLLPMSWRPEAQFGTYIPGLGALLTLFIILATGVIATNFFWQAHYPILGRPFSPCPRCKNHLLQCYFNCLYGMIMPLIRPFMYFLLAIFKDVLWNISLHCTFHQFYE